MSKLKIIGGSGFIGTNFIDNFKNDYDITILDIRDSQSYPMMYEYCDIRDKNMLKACLQPDDIVINLAAEHHDDVSPSDRYYETNSLGAKNLSEVAREKGISKIVFTSTVAVYGLSDDPKSEESPTVPFNHYGKSKLMAEKHYIDWQSECNTDLVIIRPTAIFGPGNKGNVYNLFNQIARNRFIMISKGENIKSVGYIDNISHFIRTCLRASKNTSEIYNFVDKPDLTTSELVSLVKSCLNRNGSKLYIPYWLAYGIGLLFDLFGQITARKFIISSIRIKKFCSSTIIECNSSPKDYKQVISLEDGISKTIDSDFRNFISN